MFLVNEASKPLVDKLHSHRSIMIDNYYDNYLLLYMFLVLATTDMIEYSCSL